jgi:four helix bundle protein
MTAARTFEDLVAWQKARLLSRSIHRATRGQRFSRDPDLRSQIRRAAISVVSNIAEGFERQGRAEFSRFLLIAKGSCGEVRAQLCVALDEGYIAESDFTILSTQAAEVSRIISGLHSSLKVAPSK